MTMYKKKVNTELILKRKMIDHKSSISNIRKIVAHISCFGGFYSPPLPMPVIFVAVPKVSVIDREICFKRIFTNTIGNIGSKL